MAILYLGQLTVFFLLEKKITLICIYFLRMKLVIRIIVYNTIIILSSENHLLTKTTPMKDLMHIFDI